jgi:carboxypeptidase Q
MRDTIADTSRTLLSQSQFGSHNKMTPLHVLIMPAVFLCHAAAYEYTLVDDGMRSIANTIIQGAFTNMSSTYDRLAYATTVFGPRFSGSASLERALDWINQTASQQDGIRVIQEPVQVPTWVRGNESAVMTSPRYAALHMVGLGMSTGTNGQYIEAEVLAVSSYAELQNRSSEAVGKIVLFNVPFVTYGSTVTYRANAAVWAAGVGAVAALIRSISPYGIQTPHTGGSTPSTVPAAALSIEDANMIQRLQSYNLPVVVKLYMEARTLPDSPSRNLIMEIPGTSKPDEYVLIGGHSDSWDIAAGAMDDGGGSFASWEAIRLIQTLGIKPLRTIRAVFWVNEENGARGGSQYALDYAATLANTSIAIECDEGAFTPYGLTFSGYGSALNQLILLGELLAPIGAGNISQISGATGTDIAPLCSAGVPCGGQEVLDPRIGSFSNNPCMPFSVQSGTGEVDQISDGYFWFHHTAADTIERMDPVSIVHCFVRSLWRVSHGCNVLQEQLQRVAASLAVWAVTIANLPELLPRYVRKKNLSLAQSASWPQVTL